GGGALGDQPFHGGGGWNAVEGHVDQGRDPAPRGGAGCGGKTLPLGASGFVDVHVAVDESGQEHLVRGEGDLVIDGDGGCGAVGQYLLHGTVGDHDGVRGDALWGQDPVGVDGEGGAGGHLGVWAPCERGARLLPRCGLGRDTARCLGPGLLAHAAVGHGHQCVGVGAGGRGDLGLLQGTATQAGDEHGGQCLGGGGLVDDVARDLAQIGAQALGGRGEGLAVEDTGGQMAGDELVGVQVPALEVAALQGTAHQACVQTPGGAHLGGGAGGHDVAAAVGEPHPGSGRRHLHDGLGVVGDRVGQALVRGGHPHRGAVVVGAVVQGGDPACTGADHGCHCGGAVVEHDRLGRLD